jgi:hypothetical protein
MHADMHQKGRPTPPIVLPTDRTDVVNSSCLVHVSQSICGNIYSLKSILFAYSIDYIIVNNGHVSLGTPGITIVWHDPSSARLVLQVICNHRQLTCIVTCMYVYLSRSVLTSIGLREMIQ